VSNHCPSPSPDSGLNCLLRNSKRDRLRIEAGASLFIRGPPVLRARHDHLTRALAVYLGMVDLVGDQALFGERLRSGDELAACANDERVSRAEVLVAAVVDRAHRLGYGAVLDADPGDT